MNTEYITEFTGQIATLFEIGFSMIVIQQFILYGITSSMDLFKNLIIRG